MYSFAPRHLIAVIMAAGVATVLTAAPETAPAAPEIKKAELLRFTPQPLTAWYVDGSKDGSGWSELAGPFFATGAPVDHFQPSPGGSRKLRLRYVDPASIGNAPVGLSGTTVLMDHDGGPVEVVFMNANRGFLRIDDLHARSFTYTWQKQSPDDGEAILSGLDGTFTLLRLKFIDGQLGRWGMEDIPSPQSASLIKQPLDAGGFTFRKGRFRRGVENAELPSRLTGRSMILNEAGRLTHLRFTGAASVIIKAEAGPSIAGKFSYDPQDPLHGKLRLNPLNGPGLDLSLDLRTPGSGRFEEILPGGGPGSRSGTFSLPDEQSPAAAPDCPPKDLGGRSILINDSTPCTLTFNGDGTGLQTKDVDGAIQATPFTYSYSPTGSDSASVAVTFAGTGNDLIDDYDLDFDDDCAGSFKRQSYAGGNSRQGSQGTFQPGALAGN